MPRYVPVYLVFSLSPSFAEKHQQMPFYKIATPVRELKRATRKLLRREARRAMLRCKCTEFVTCLRCDEDLPF